jgi:hypothetical protein
VAAMQLALVSGQERRNIKVNRKDRAFDPNKNLITTV